jgi:RNA polymerase sigma-70 factor (ECF subfamily)
MAGEASLTLAREAAAAQPVLHADPVAFAAHLDALAARGVVLPASVGDLYLAFAAAGGDAAAIEQLERNVMPAAIAALRVIGTSSDALDECLQRVRMALLIGRDDAHPRLLDYRGQGTLRAWVRVVAVRESLMMHRSRKEIALGDAVLASVPDAGDDPELRYLRGEMRDHLAGAVASALAVLSSRERALLRYSLIDGLTLDEIGAIYGAHKSSVSRWLSRTRERLWQAARDQLTAELAGQSEQISSLVRRLRSGLDLSLERLLAD